MRIWLGVDCIKKEILLRFPNAQIEEKTKNADAIQEKYTSVHITIANGVYIPLSYYGDDKRVALDQCKVYLSQGNLLPTDQIIEACT